MDGSTSGADVDLMDELLDPEYWDVLEPSGNISPSYFFPNQILGDGGDEDESDMNWLVRTPTVPLEDKLQQALRFIKQSQLDSDVLIQIWVPVGVGGRQLLTTCGQPFWLDPNCDGLRNYRSVSLGYQFSASEGGGELTGLPGRVFLGRVPEWTPDVRYFSSPEYPRVGHAQRYNVRGSVALPIFERDGRSCVGVVEVVSTAQKVNYRSDVENICNALQAVDLSSSNVRISPCIKESNDSYRDALPEIFNMLRAVCETHSLPLAQAWIPCIQQGKPGTRHCEDNFRNCVSTVDAACFVNDVSVLGFHEACSEHHLFKGQGVVGKAFTTSQPCFSPDITSFIKTEYPLSHHAKLFRLRAAVAIQLRSVRSVNANFVLEFFLPTDCTGSEEQKSVLNSLSVTIQQVCQSLRVVTAKELEDETSLQPCKSLDSDFPYKNVFEGIKSRKKEAIHLAFSKQENEEFSAMTSWDPPKGLLLDERASSEFSKFCQDVGNDTNDQRDTFSSEPKISNYGKATEKRRAKMEKTVSLQVLRQHFAGSLKDAAKNIGVCPTTLKRICRQHGITRWPSRKIKKVGHSLKKLQVVIDSVRGAKGTFQFSSLYDDFTKSSPPIKGSNTASTLKPTDQPDPLKEPQQEEGISNFRTYHSNSLSSSRSHSSSSSLGCSSGSKQGVPTPQAEIKQETPIDTKQTAKLKRAHSNVELQFSNPGPVETLVRSVSHDIFTDKLSLENPCEVRKQTSSLKVKAIYGEEKVRFRLQPEWGFQELKQEIARRFNLSDLSSLHLKYLDDDSEWVLLTCGADLQECINVYKASTSETIRISVQYRVAPSSMKASVSHPV